MAEFNVSEAADDQMREVERKIFKMWLPSPSMWAWVIRQFTTG